MRKHALLLVFLGCLSSTSAYAVDIQEVIGPKSGVKAWLVEDHNLPIIAMHLAFLGGSEQDPVDLQGLATLTMDAMTEGAGPYDATTFQKELADHSIVIDLSAERDQIAGNLKCLSTDKQKAFELLHATLTKPHFDPKDIERLRSEQLAALRHQMSDPNWQARYALFSQIFAGHPYSERHLGTTQTLASITLQDIKDFWTHHIAKDNVIVAVAGDMTAGELATALDKIFLDVPSHAQLTTIPEVSETSDTPTIIVHREGTQSDILFSMPGPKRDDPDWYAAEIANYILGGGGFSSRLMQDVRDKKGLTYGIDTDLSAADHAGLILGQAAVDNPKVGEALETMRDTMKHFHDDGVTPHELTAAKDYLTGSEPLLLTSTDKIAEVLVDMQQHKLGRDYLDRYGDLIRGVKMADIDQVIERWFNPDKITWVMVGQPTSVISSQTKDLIKQ